LTQPHHPTGANVSTLTWQKSSHSGSGSNCLNVAAAPDGTIRLLESDAPDTVLTTTPTGLRTLLLAIKAGEFNDVAL
jgi:hypothetical protein